MNKRNWLGGLIFAALLLGVYVLSRYGLPRLYTPEWSARNIFWPIAVVILLAALWGKRWFSALALAGYVLGMAAGEVLGGWEADVGPQFLHHGWWIMLLVFFAGCGAGAVVQRRRGKKKGGKSGA